MLRFINNLPSHVVGIHAAGEVTKEDLEKALMPRLDELAKKQGEINYLLVLETGVQNFTAGAWLEDIKAGLKHFTQWNKIAIVSDQKGVEWFTDLVSLVIPGKSKGFPLSQLDKAVTWVSKVEAPAA
jgi:hypothetical protein